ncbi:serine protease [Streptomyces bambusae]|uniref:S1 family peptidase n=1 Tax=Streptomyces bambusae TaxID=1550616 RepID=UPI001CFC4B01|nr:serine protease [Streptomyces bambusae]MCB5165148.1 serine protease [Streptomyces bambusae]
MIISKTVRRVSAAGFASAIAAGLMATSAAPAGAAQQPGDAEAMRIIQSVSGAQHAPERDSYIIGGTKTTIKNYPYMAQLFVEVSPGRGSFCGGAVINSRKILTAAHCVSGRNFVTKGVVVTGATRLADGSSLYGGKAFRIKKQWQHPKYNSRTFDNDIAVLTLAAPTNAKTIKVTTSTDKASYRPGTKATAVGWGRTSSTSQAISTYLRRATLPIQADSKCTSPSVWGRSFIKGHMLCVGNKTTGSDRTTVAPCNGDSGGPLVVNGRVVGVTSWGVKNCVQKGLYPVYTKYSTYAKTVAAQLR